MIPLPITWQELFNWCTIRLTLSEAYSHADALWKQIATHLIDDLRDEEVETLSTQLIAQYGEVEIRHEGPTRPNTSEREVPYEALNKRLTHIEKRRSWLALHQGMSNCEVVSPEHMIAISVNSPPPPSGYLWRWEVVLGNSVEHSDTAKSQEEAWEQAHVYWETARHRMLRPILLKTPLI